MNALAAFLEEQSETEKETFLTFIVPCNVLDVSHQPAQAETC